MDVDRSHAVLIAPSERSHAFVERVLRQNGAGSTCHVIAHDLESDGQDIPLSEAVAEAVSHEWGVVLCCRPGALAFYKEEAPGDWFLLVRRPAA